MAELSNCPKCDRLFVRNLSSICDVCRKEEEKMFQTVYDFVRKRENRTATVSEISEETGVEEEVIMRFVKEGRLRQTQFPNLAYPCERCQKNIQKGKLCDACQRDMKQDLAKYDKEKQREQEQKQENNTYFAVDEKHKRHR